MQRANDIANHDQNPALPIPPRVLMLCIPGGGGYGGGRGRGEHANEDVPMVLAYRDHEPAITIDHERRTANV